MKYVLECTVDGISMEYLSQIWRKQNNDLSIVAFGDFFFIAGCCLMLMMLLASLNWLAEAPKPRKLA